jgi:hypothetical protein
MSSFEEHYYGPYHLSRCILVPYATMSLNSLHDKMMHLCLLLLDHPILVYYMAALNKYLITYLES